MGAEWRGSMDFIKNNRAAVVVAVLIVGMVTMGVIANSSSDKKAEDAKQTSEAKDKASKDKKADDAKKDTDTKATHSHDDDDHSDDVTVTKTAKGVSIAALAGDSYTTLARKIVQNADSKLSKAQVVAAETYLTQWANEPAVDVEDVVLIKQADLDKAVKKAKNLGKADIAAWNTYVPYVEF